MGNTTAYVYDAVGNLLRVTDALGNVLERTYGAANELLSETLSGPSTPGATSRNVYDSHRHLRFAVSAEGRVTEYRYNTLGQLVSTLSYTEALYPAAAERSETALAAWTSTAMRAATRTDTSYDFRGNVATVTRYGTVAANGDGIIDAKAIQTRYVYDPAGRLLQRYAGPIGTPKAEQFTYDGLGRLLTQTAFDGTLTLTTYDDANQKVTVTYLPLRYRCRSRS